MPAPRARVAAPPVRGALDLHPLRSLGGDVVSGIGGRPPKGHQDAMLRNGIPEPIRPMTHEDARKAALNACHWSTDMDDARMLCDALGVVPVLRSCSCDPRHLEVGGYDSGCPVHDPLDNPATTY